MDKTLVFKLTDERVVVPIGASGIGTAASAHRSQWKRLGVLRRPNSASDGPLVDPMVWPAAVTAKEENTEFEHGGSWTMIYDEGFQVDSADNITFTGLLKYTRSEAGDCRGKLPADGDQEESDGATLCYVTDPSQTSLGWYTDYSNPTARRFGCWYGHQIAESTVGSIQIGVAKTKQKGGGLYVSVPLDPSSRANRHEPVVVSRGDGGHTESE